MLTFVTFTDDLTEMPAWPLFWTTVLRMNAFPPSFFSRSMPVVGKPKMSQFSRVRARPASHLTPLMPVPIPLIRRWGRMTTSFGPAWTTIPFVPLTNTDATWPPPSIVIGLVIVTAPYPAGSRASISPAAAVLEIAPANVLHGAVRLHGLASSPTPETQVRLACAVARDTISKRTLVPIKRFFSSIDKFSFRKADFAELGSPETPKHWLGEIAVDSITRTDPRMK